MTTPTITGALDIGNGYVKGVIYSTHNNKKIEDTIDTPSAVTIIPRENQVPTPDNQAPETLAADYYNNLDASFNTPLINNRFRHLFGRRALTADGPLEQFAIEGRLSKAEQSLSSILVLGFFAAKALKDYVATHKTLPDTMLTINAIMSISLPIQEYNSHRNTYIASFKDNTHVITVHNFETPVTVRINFINVQVLPEGASAQYAITDKGVPLMNAMLQDVRVHGIELPGITAQDVLAAQNTVGVDIGEGTVNFPVFTNGEFNSDASRTFHKGYGTVLNAALKAMDDDGFNTGFTSRKQLADYLQRTPSPLKQNVYNKIVAYVNQEIDFFVKEVATEFGKVLATVGAMTEVAFVYGGGATPVKEALYPVLINKAQEMNAEDSFPILYLNSEYSRYLNREGLLVAANMATEMEKTAKKKK